MKSRARHDPALASDLRQRIAEYLDQQMHRGLAAATVVWRRRTLAALARHLEERRVRALRQVREVHLAEWVVWLSTDRRSRRAGAPPARYAPATAGQMILQVRAFFRWLCRRGALLIDPARELTTAGLIVDRIAGRAIPTESAMRELLDGLPRETLIQIRDAAILELMYSSGLRVSEVYALDVYDVDLDAGTVRVARGKGGRERLVPVGRTARAALVRWLSSGRLELATHSAERALFVTRFGRRLRPGMLGTRWRYLRLKLARSLPRPHDLRHACALHLLRGGADVRHVQEILGHARVKTTAIYTRLAPADLKDAHRRCHPRERHREPR